MFVDTPIVNQFFPLESVLSIETLVTNISQSFLTEQFKENSFPKYFSPRSDKAIQLGLFFPNTSQRFLKKQCTWKHLRRGASDNRGHFRHSRRKTSGKNTNILKRVYCMGAYRFYNAYWVYSVYGVYRICTAYRN